MIPLKVCDTPSYHVFNKFLNLPDKMCGTQIQFLLECLHFNKHMFIKPDLWYVYVKNKSYPNQLQLAEI